MILCKIGDKGKLLEDNVFDVKYFWRNKGSFGNNDSIITVKFVGFFKIDGVMKESQK